jgi:hypothetical protein
MSNKSNPVSLLPHLVFLTSSFNIEGLHNIVSHSNKVWFLLCSLETRGQCGTVSTEYLWTGWHSIHRMPMDSMAQYPLNICRQYCTVSTEYLWTVWHSFHWISVDSMAHYPLNVCGQYGTLSTEYMWTIWHSIHRISVDSMTQHPLNICGQYDTISTEYIRTVLHNIHWIVCGHYCTIPSVSGQNWAILIDCGQYCAISIQLPSICQAAVNISKENISGLQKYFQWPNMVAELRVTASRKLVFLAIVGGSSFE